MLCIRYLRSLRRSGSAGQPNVTLSFCLRQEKSSATIELSRSFQGSYGHCGADAHRPPSQSYRALLAQPRYPVPTRQFGTGLFCLDADSDPWHTDFGCCRRGRNHFIERALWNSARSNRVRHCTAGATACRALLYMVTAAEIRERIADWSAGRLTLCAFVDWFVPATWNIHKTGDSVAATLTDEVELNLSERSDGTMTDAEFRAAMLRLTE